MGKWADFLSQSYPPASEFNEADVPDLSGKVFLITGANTGIGKETARVLLAHNAKVYIACRSPERAKAAVDELKEKTGNEAHLLSLDLASFASIRSAAADFTSRESRLDVLFNNAGVMDPPIEQLTKEGYDLQFGTNVLGPYLLTTLLLPTLLATAKETGDARVVNTSSLGHVLGPPGGVDYDTLKPGAAGSAGDVARRRMGTSGLYYQSKCGPILFSNELAKRYGAQGLVSTSLNPGNIQSDLGRHWVAVKKLMMKLFVTLHPVSQGALTQLYAGTSPDAKLHNGKYLIPWARVGNTREDMADPEASAKLWAWMEAQVSENKA